MEEIWIRLKSIVMKICLMFLIYDSIRKEYADGKKVIVVPADIVYEGDMTIDLGGCTVKLMQTPAPIQMIQHWFMYAKIRHSLSETLPVRNSLTESRTRIGQVYWLTRSVRPVPKLVSRDIGSR